MLVLSWVAIPEAQPSPRSSVLCVSSFLSPPTLKLPKGVAAVRGIVCVNYPNGHVSASIRLTGRNFSAEQRQP